MVLSDNLGSDRGGEGRLPVLDEAALPVEMLYLGGVELPAVKAGLRDEVDAVRVWVVAGGGLEGPFVSGQEAFAVILPGLQALTRSDIEAALAVLNEGFGTDFELSEFPTFEEEEAEDTAVSEAVSEDLAEVHKRDPAAGTRAAGDWKGMPGILFTDRD